jgi:Sulfite exporter TauE/SafE.
VEGIYLVVGLGAALAAFVQGLAGFGFGLTAMSVWAWTLEPQLAAVLAVFGGLAGQVLAACTVRRGLAFGLLWPFIAGGLAGVPLGTWLLPYLDAAWFKAIVGAILALWCPAMLLSANLPRISADNRLADAAIGMAGGVMGGLGGFTGLLPTLWCTLRGMGKDAQRAIIRNFNLAMLAVAMSLYLARGMVTRPMLPLFALVLPAILLPALAGSRVYARISDAAFRRVVLALLTASGAAMLASGLATLLARGS